ncbi:MAG TPA: precorrin-3B C(17)-methyltransferase [Devosiaceae bacterium]|nr:precorrin-3B C(17)-methyltransferase [Devosiaceae bacterium]
MKPAILTFAASGEATAERIAVLTGGTVHACGPTGENAKTLLPGLFRAGMPIVGVCAAGILIRLLAPLIANKHAEPPVLAVSQDGAHVVPLLGGHHGANRLAREIATGLGGAAALTTASDSRFAFGLDEPPQGWVLENPAAAKPAMAALLNGGAIALSGSLPWLEEAGYPISPEGAVSIAAGEAAELAADLVYRPKTLVAGVGCERGAAPAEVIGLIAETLTAAGLSPLSLAAIASIDIKADEAAIHAAAAHFGVPARFFALGELDAQRSRLKTPSAVVEAEIGTPGVAEAAALCAGELIVPKKKSQRATCAIGRAPSPVDLETLGRAQGILHVVGIGPGDGPSRTASAVAAVEASGDWVGYGLYLDLIADLRHGQEEHRFGLGDEEPRVRHALELAATGKTVALVCSGDAQIYAMASLVHELLAATGPRAVSGPARRVAVETHPGISAFQAASSAAGALIGHDFCCISLSDLLTPRETILARLAAAAAGDFVAAFYNPRSGRRTELLGEAARIFRAHRPPTTPVIVARNLGRPEQQVKTVPLAEFDPETVDMLTIVMIGSSTSRVFARGDGSVVAYTPRGYAKKAEGQ